MTKLRHLLLDVDFDNHPDVLDISENFGELAAWYLVKLMLAMSKTSCGIVTESTASAIAKRTGIKDYKAILDRAREIKFIIHTSEGYSNRRVEDDRRALQEKREQTAKRVTEYRSKRVTDALQTQNGSADRCVTPDTDPDTGSEDLDLKETVPPFLVGNSDGIAALQRLTEYFASIGKPYDEIQIQCLQSQWAHDPGSFVSSVDACVLGRWKNFRPVAEEETKSQKKSGKHEKFELVLSAVRKFGANWEDAKKVLPVELHPAIRQVGWGTFCRASGNDPGIKNRFFEALG